MARIDIHNLWDGNMRIAINENFKELYNEYIGAGLDAKDAREKAINAVATSDLAKQLAEQANLTSEQVRNEMNNIIREQTSGGDVVPEVVSARGEKATLGERLNSTDQQLAETTAEVSFAELKANETNYYDLLSRNSSNIGGHLLSVLGDRNILADIKLTENNSVELELRKNNNDDFIKFRNVNLKTFDQTTVKQNYSNVIAGNMVGTSGNNHYTDVIGTKIQQVFTGVGISMAYYVDIFSFRSGMWKCYIDDVHVKDISQHPDAVDPADYILNNLALTEIASGLDNKEHTLVVEYVGSDPDNPSDSPRGWIRINDGSSGNPLSNRESFEWIEQENVTVPMLYDSNKEFAFSVDLNETNGNQQWFPEHNNLGTLFAGKQELFIDGINRSIESPATYNFIEAKITQKLFGRHPSFTGDVCEFIIVATINHLGINFETKVKWLQNAYIHNGYVNMFTINPTFADNLITSLGGQYDLNITDGSNTEIVEEIPYSFTIVSDKHADFYATLSSHSPKRSFRFGEPNAGGNADGTNYYYIQHRSATLQKLYPRTYQRHNVVAGEVFKFDGHFGFGFLPDVANLV